MKKPLKVFLWVLAVIGILALGLVGAGGYYFYRAIDKFALSYTCQNYLDLIDSIVADEPAEKQATFNEKMNGQATGLYMYLFTISRNPGIAESVVLSNPETVTHAVNELTSLCRAKPTLGIWDILDAETKGNLPQAEMDAAAFKANMHIEALLKDVPLQTDPTSTMFAQTISLEFVNRNKINALLTSATAVTPTAAQSPEWSTLATPTTPPAQ